MARRPEAVTRLRRVVGAALAAYLDASPLNQGDLARLTNYHRTSISHIQAGRQFPERGFWETVDQALGVGGALVAQYDHACDHIEQLRHAELERQAAQRQARALTHAGTPGQVVDGPDEPGLSAPWTDRGTVEVSVALSGSGGLVKRRTFGLLSGAALTAPAHQWLVQEPGQLAAALGGDRVSPELADRLPPMIAELRRMDDVSGGDVILDLAEREFSWVAGLLDRATYTEPTARKLHLALAELGQCTGWIARDAGLHALAQRYWIAALRAAHTADDPALGAYVLWSMADQAADLGRPAEAATLIETARLGIRDRATPALLAGLHSMQAKAQAILHDGSGCASAVAKASSWAEQIQPEGEPPWLYWVNRVQITARAGRVLLRLGRADQAVHPLAGGVRQLDNSMVRDRQMFLADWAEALAQPGQQQDLEEAASRGLEAVTLAEGLCSTRANKRVRDLCTQMEPHAMVPAVREFLQRARAVAT